VVEHHIDTVGVTGSNPVSRTIPFFHHADTVGQFNVVKLHVFEERSVSSLLLLNQEPTLVY